MTDTLPDPTGLPGAADVVGSRWAVDDSAAAQMTAAFHHFLTHQGNPSAR